MTDMDSTLTNLQETMDRGTRLVAALNASITRQQGAQNEPT